jgi:hypothetical protein
MLMAEHRCTTKWENYAAKSSGLLFVLMGWPSAETTKAYLSKTGFVGEGRSFERKLALRNRVNAAFTFSSAPA